MIIFLKNASNRPFLTTDKYWLPAALHRKAPGVEPTGFVVFVTGNLPVTIKRLYSINENMTTALQDPAFPERERGFYD